MIKQKQGQAWVLSASESGSFEGSCRCHYTETSPFVPFPFSRKMLWTIQFPTAQSRVCIFIESVIPTSYVFRKFERVHHSFFGREKIHSVQVGAVTNEKVVEKVFDLNINGYNNCDKRSSFPFLFLFLTMRTWTYFWQIAIRFYY